MNGRRRFDVVIVGGGLVGATLAEALRPTGLDVALVEARPLPASAAGDDYDERSLALGWGSRQILAGLGLWEALAAHATAMTEVHVSQRGRFGATRLRAAAEGLPALGYVVTLRRLGALLAERLAHHPRLTVYRPAEARAVEARADHVRIEVAGGAGNHSLEARLLVAADGSDSPLRARLGIPVRETDYGQWGVIGNLSPRQPPAGRAFERFTADGPLALLPLGADRCAFVWTLPPAAAERALALDDGAFLTALQERFGHRLGRLQRVGRRQGFPLRQVRPQRLVAGRAVLIGNAAHTLHPIAGQGFNLALRDVAELAQRLARAADPGAPALLAAYQRHRQADIDATQRATDALLRLFTSPWPPLSHARAAGLLLLDRLPPLKHRLARLGMGWRAGQQGPLFAGRALAGGAA